MHSQPLSSSCKVVQNGREVYKWACWTPPLGISELLEQANYKDEVKWFSPHSDNLKMIESICERLDFHSLLYIDL